MGFVVGESVIRQGGILFALGVMALAGGAIVLRNRRPDEASREERPKRGPDEPDAEQITSRAEGIRRRLDQLSFDLKLELSQIARSDSTHEEQLDRITNRLDELSEVLEQSNSDRRLDDKALEERIDVRLDGLSSGVDQIARRLDSLSARRSE